MTTFIYQNDLKTSHHKKRYEVEIKTRELQWL